MGIYRGSGGTGDASGGATISEVAAYSVAAEDSAEAAALSETNAASSASSAATSASNAASSASSAASSATAASGSASSASTSASNASTSETNAASSATAAAGSATSAGTSATNAASSAAAASSSATAAASSASAAATSATNASNSAAAASTSAINAASSATAAAGSASAASASADAALAALDSFDDRYLGQKSVEPTLDNDGNALVTGALYFNTVDNAMKVYDGTQWLNAYASLSGALLANYNLSDLTNVVDARTNLGLGTAATTNSTAYATAAQGALADTALQPATIGVSVQGYNANTVIDASYVHTDNNFTSTLKSKLDGIEAGAEVNVNADWNAASGDAQILNKPTLGTAAATDSTAYATAAQGTKADTAYGWGNHASAGYLTSFTETDPVYVASSWYSTTNNAGNWNTAYGWGNHASAGYLTSSSTIDGGTY